MLSSEPINIVIPAWSNEPVALLKSTAVVFLMAVSELMAKAKPIGAQTYDSSRSYVAVAIVYLRDTALR